MNKILTSLKPAFYFISAWIFILITPHKFSILGFIKDIIFCLGWYWLIDNICDYIEYKIKMKAFEKEMNLMRSKMNDPLFTTTKK